MRNVTVRLKIPRVITTVALMLSLLPTLYFLLSLVFEVSLRLTQISLIECVTLRQTPFAYSNLQLHYNMNALKEACVDLCWDASFFNRGWSSRGVGRDGAREGRSHNNTGIIRATVAALMSCTCAQDGRCGIPILNVFTCRLRSIQLSKYMYILSLDFKSVISSIPTLSRLILFHLF